MVFMPGSLLNQFPVRAGRIAEFPDRLRGNVRRLAEAIQSDFSEPCRVLQIGLPTRKILDEERIHEMDFRDAFEDGMYWYPVDPS